MRVYFAADHAGFELKNTLMNFVRGELGHDVEDCGAFERDPSDDYSQIIARAAKKLADDAAKGMESRAILIGASGQGEAMAANRFRGVRAAVYYGGNATQTDSSGKALDIITSSRSHNDANALSLGARFIGPEVAQSAVRTWLETPFSAEERHARRIASLDRLDEAL